MYFLWPLHRGLVLILMPMIYAQIAKPYPEQAWVTVVSLCQANPPNHTPPLSVLARSGQLLAKLSPPAPAAAASWVRGPRWLLGRVLAGQLLTAIQNTGAVLHFWYCSSFGNNVNLHHTEALYELTKQKIVHPLSFFKSKLLPHRFFLGSLSFP